MSGRGGYPGLRGNYYDARRGSANRGTVGYNQCEKPINYTREFECALCQPDSHKAQAEFRKRRSKKIQDSTTRRSQNVKSPSPTPHWQINIKTPTSQQHHALQQEVAKNG